MKKFLKFLFSQVFGMLFSKVSGFLRDIFIAKYLGNGYWTDLFFTIYRIPNFFRNVFIDGAMNSSFVPIYSSGIQKFDKKKMMSFSRNVFSIMFYCLILFTLLVEIFMPYIVKIFAPGYSNDKEMLSNIILLTRITFPYLVLIFITSLCCCILNTFNKFFISSFYPVFLNFALIFFLLISKNLSNLEIVKMLSYGIIVGAFLQLLWVYIFCLKEKVFLYPTTIKITKQIKIFFYNFFNSFLATGIIQINSMIDSIIASTIKSGVSIIYYSSRIYNFPLSLIGTSIAYIILPSLSKELSKKNIQNSQNIQENAIFLSCFIGIPAGLGIFTLAQPITQLLFQRGNFTIEDTIKVSSVLKIYSLIIPFFILSKIFRHIFYAKKDTIIPRKNSIQSLIINVILSIILSKYFGIIGIAISTLISQLFSVYYLFKNLLTKNIFKLTDNLYLKLLKIIYSSIIMSVFCFGTYKLFINFNLLINLFFSISVAGIIFLFLSICLGIIDIQEIKEICYRKN